ncbi:MAG TPA: hypothetical protein VE591_08290, partial [Candidatus Acidoferrum sp.]|nr:hypothetical protein [Candidatus Acidoferrum sp.]
VVANGVAKKQPVTLGATSDTQAVVRKGLRPGETIVVDRNAGIVDGVTVTPTALPSATANAHA